jgi:tRNA threonylcarbamoyladenosine biosynthesis protein TsaB
MSEITLALDGSTYSPTTALLRDGKLISDERLEAPQNSESGGRGEALLPLIAKMLETNGLTPRQITSVICGSGPGSFTSLRVAASVAKGIAVASGAKMYAVRSLLLHFAGAPGRVADGRYLAVLPAMRGDLFVLDASVRKGIPAASGGHSVLPETDLPTVAKSAGARVIGPGQEIDVTPHARGAVAMYDAILAAGPVDIRSWEPDYGRLAEAQVKWEATHGRPVRA